MSYRRVFRKKESGQVAMLMTFASVPMIGLLGMATDLGYMHYVKQSAQAAADAAAMAAISQFHSMVTSPQVTCGQTNVVCGTSYQCPTNLTTSSSPRDTACLYAKQNGFQATGNQNVLIDSNTGANPPSTAPGLNSAVYWISVRVSQQVPQLFSAITGNPTGLVSARATAAAVPAKDCLYALDPSDAGGLYMNGNSTATLACGVFVNSSNATQAMYDSGNSNNLTATNFDIVGGYSWTGNLVPSTPNTGVPHAGDPLAYLTPPSPCDAAGGCEAADCTAHPNQVNPSNGDTLQPGTYCGGIAVAHGTVNLASGTYIIVGGGISTQDTSGISGSGVTIYNTYNSSHAYTPMNFPAHSSTSLSAPTTGSYAGILFFGDRSLPTSPTPTYPYAETIWGGSGCKFDGSIYFPKSVLSFGGNPLLTSANYTILVGWQVSVQGTSYINANYSELPGGAPSNTSVGMIE